MPDTIDDIAARHGFTADAARALSQAIRAGGGRMAQFSHTDLGGMGQWAEGGMIMIGDMFNSDLKARVAALAADLAAAHGPVPAAAEQRSGQGAHWWPADLGDPSATGAQNEMRYACFPAARRLAVMLDGKVRVYDTGEHRITGFSQAQSSVQTLRFQSQNGAVSLDELQEV